MPKDENKSSGGEIAKYISNPRGDIYTVSGLPEEVVAVIFAYVSRSPKSFRENIGKVLAEQELGRERAAKFHEKWVLNYGHASVAEHASIHIGVERVSRLFSSLLETGGEHLSFTEYSQRYQKPRKDDFVVPPEITGNKALSREFLSACARQYEVYEKLNLVLFDFLKSENPRGAESALEKLAFEDARYALNLAAMTNLGMTANARAVEDCLSRLLSSEYAEARLRAEEIKKEVRFSVPTLVKYAAKNPHITGARERLRDLTPSPPPNVKPDAPLARLVDWTGKGESDPQAAALRRISAMLFYPARGATGESMTGGECEAAFKAAIDGLGSHDNPHDALRLVSYTAEFVISEACWHQLLRHRKTDWFAAEPGVSSGVTVPPNIAAAGEEGLLLEAAGIGAEMHGKLSVSGFPQAAAYAVTNAHNRRVAGNMSLWQLYHLINLRMSDGAQWDIKRLTDSLAAQVREIHPVLVQPALDRIGAAGP